MWGHLGLSVNLGGNSRLGVSGWHREGCEAEEKKGSQCSDQLITKVEAPYVPHRRAYRKKLPRFSHFQRIVQ